MKSKQSLSPFLNQEKSKPYYQYGRVGTDTDPYPQKGFASYFKKQLSRIGNNDDAKKSKTISQNQSNLEDLLGKDASREKRKNHQSPPRMGQSPTSSSPKKSRRQEEEADSLRRQLHSAHRELEELSRAHKEELELMEQKSNDMLQVVMDLNENLKNQVEDLTRERDALKKQGAGSTLANKLAANKSPGKSRKQLSSPSSAEVNLEKELHFYKDRVAKLEQSKNELKDMLKNAQNAVLKQQQHIDQQYAPPELSQQSSKLSKQSDAKLKKKPQHTSKAHSFNSQQIIKELDYQGQLILDLFTHFEVDDNDTFARKIARIRFLYDSQVQKNVELKEMIEKSKESKSNNNKKRQSRSSSSDSNKDGSRKGESCETLIRQFKQISEFINALVENRIILKNEPKIGGIIADIESHSTEKLSPKTEKNRNLLKLQQIIDLIIGDFKRIKVIKDEVFVKLKQENDSLTEQISQQNIKLKSQSNEIERLQYHADKRKGKDDKKEYSLKGDLKKSADSEKSTIKKLTQLCEDLETQKIQAEFELQKLKESDQKKFTELMEENNKISMKLSQEAQALKKKLEEARNKKRKDSSSSSDSSDDDKKKKKKALKQEIQDLQSKLEKAEKLNKDTKQKQKEQEEEIKKLKQQASPTKKPKQDDSGQKSEITKLQKKIHDLETELKQSHKLKEEVENLQKIIKKQDGKSPEKDKQDLEKEMENHKKQLSEMKKHYEEEIKQLKENKNSKSDQIKKVEELEKKLEKKEKEYDELKEKLKELEKQLKKQMESPKKQDEKEDSKKYEDEIKNLKKSIEEKEKSHKEEIKKLEEEHNKSKKDNKDSKQESEKYEQEIKELKKKLEEQENSLKEEIKKLKSGLEGSKSQDSQVDKYQAEIKELKEKLNTSEKSYREEIEKLKSEAENNKSKAESEFKIEIEKYESRIKEINTKFEEQGNKNTASQECGQCAEQQKSIDELNAQKTKLEEEKKALQDEILEQGKIIKEQIETINQLKEQLAESQKTILEIQQICGGSDPKEVASRYQEMESQYQFSKQQNEQLEQFLATSMQENEALKKKDEENQQQITELKLMVEKMQQMSEEEPKERLLTAEDVQSKSSSSSSSNSSEIERLQSQIAEKDEYILQLSAEYEKLEQRLRSQENKLKLKRSTTITIDYFWDLEVTCSEGHLLSLVNSSWRFNFRNPKGIQDYVSQYSILTMNQKLGQQFLKFAFCSTKQFDGITTSMLSPETVQLKSIVYQSFTQSKRQKVQRKYGKMQFLAFCKLLRQESHQGVKLVSENHDEQAALEEFWIQYCSRQGGAILLVVDSVEQKEMAMIQQICSVQERARIIVVYLSSSLPSEKEKVQIKELAKEWKFVEGSLEDNECFEEQRIWLEVCESRDRGEEVEQWISDLICYDFKENNNEQNVLEEMRQYMIQSRQQFFAKEEDADFNIESEESGDAFNLTLVFSEEDKLGQEKKDKDKKYKLNAKREHQYVSELREYSGVKVKDKKVKVLIQVEDKVAKAKQKVCVQDKGTLVKLKLKCEKQNLHYLVNLPGMRLKDELKAKIDGCYVKLKGEVE